MKITFYSNFLNHHQLPFCLRMRELLKDDFVFVASTPTPENRLRMGYEDMNDKYPFVLPIYNNSNDFAKAKTLLYESDITIHGSAPDIFLKLREKTRKPCFIYSERFFKPGDNSSIIKTFLAYYRHHLFRYKLNTYILCASYYTSSDYRWLGPYYNKCYAWGYFPPCKTYDINELMRNKNGKERIEILWVGRMIELKHPESAIQAAYYLHKKGIDYELKLIGDGPISTLVDQMIHSYGLTDKVIRLGSMTPDNVRKYMEEASIFLFTSDYNEGWGAVLNEAMNSGCACVVSHAIGSAGFLIENGHNGIIYPFNIQDELNNWVENLVRQKAFREKLGRHAYETINKSWNANEGATRFVKLCESIINNQATMLYDSGPCSKVYGYGNKRYKKQVKRELMRIRKQDEKYTNT